MIVGLTGGIATGKSTVTDMFRALGAYVVDADVWARRVVEPGSAALAEIVQAFGHDVLDVDGTLNRSALGRVIFHDGAARQRLNEITHPRVREGMLVETASRLRERPGDVVLWDVPLLFEGSSLALVDKTLVVYVDEQTQLARLMARNALTREEALARIHAQMPIGEKRRRADYVIDNGGTIPETREQVEHTWQDLQETLATERPSSS